MDLEDNSTRQRRSKDWRPCKEEGTIDRRIRYPRPKRRYLSNGQSTLPRDRSTGTHSSRQPARICQMTSSSNRRPHWSRLSWMSRLSYLYLALLLIVSSCTLSSATSRSTRNVSQPKHLPHQHGLSLEGTLFKGLHSTSNLVPVDSIAHLPTHITKSDFDNSLTHSSRSPSRAAPETDDLEEDNEDLLNSLPPTSPHLPISGSTGQSNTANSAPFPEHSDKAGKVAHFQENLQPFEVAVSTTSAPIVSESKATKASSTLSFDFTKSTYNVSIPENAIYKYATPTEKMGIYINDPAMTVRYKIVSGDPEKIFKAEAKRVGNFYFLLIRIRYGNNAVLNREYMAAYELRVRATVTSTRNEAFKLKSKCTVLVQVSDQNDISPIFSDTYDVSVPEDVPLDTSVVKVSADDPDLVDYQTRLPIGRNGQIYYSIAEQTNLFAIHPTTGIIYTTRPLLLSTLLKQQPTAVTHRSHRSHRDSVTAQQEHTVHLTIIATDRGFHRPSAQIIESSKAPVRISITPVNRYAPKISVKQHSTLATSLPSPQRRPIYAVVHVADQDVGVYGEICNFDIVSGNKEGVFALSNVTSSRDYNLELTRHISELSTSLLRSLPLNLLVRATDCGGKSANETIIISAENQLNLGFSFTSDTYHSQVSESTLPGTSILQVDLKFLQASDHFGSMAMIDDPTYREQFHFSIISGNDNNTFAVSRNGIIFSLLPLDREKVSKYTLVVRAQHELNRVATAMVELEVRDENDNSPIFHNLTQDSVVHLSVPENRPNGSIIYRTEATDADIGSNGLLTYELVYYGLDELPFAIDATTGDIFTVRPLDFESLPRNYHLFVRASDSGEPFRRQTQMLLNLTLVDLNDHRPTFEKTNCTAYVPLTTKPFTEIMTFTAVDLDLDSTILYRMFTSEAERCFQIKEKTGQLELTCNLKKELGKSTAKLNTVAWTITVSATDGSYFSDSNYLKVIVVGGPDITSAEWAPLGITPRDKRHIRVECTDTLTKQRHRPTTTSLLEGDSDLSFEEKEAISAMRDEQSINRSPVFEHVLTEISIPESTAVGSKIATFSANDTDTGFAGLLIWSLNLHQRINTDDASISNVYFELNQTTGELFLVSPLDYETQKQIPLNVTVCDQSLLNQKCAHQAVTILIEDVNDCAPQLEHFTFNVSETAPVHSIIGRIFATDDDSGDNAALEYYIASNEDVLSIDLFNGTLRLEKQLDRESTAKYTLYVTATDSGSPSLSSTSTVTIFVNDVNDNAPEFFQKSYFLRVREDIPIGTRLTRISAFDRDEDEAAQICYALADTFEDTFTIDELTGNIRLSKSLDYEQSQLYNLTVIATDEGKPPLSSSTYIIMEIGDVNENFYAPKFTDFYATASVKENRPVGTVVTKVTATDEDDPNLPLIYQITGGSGLGRFTIDSSGTILTAAVLDAESTTHFWLTIIAKDRAAVPLTAMLELYIEVTDENDMAPITDESMYMTAVYENISIGSIILELKAHDQDVSTKGQVNPDISFHISNQVPFEIDPKSGVIKTTDQLDRETTSRYVLDVEVSEPIRNEEANNRIERRHLDGKLLVSRTPVIVDILDVNEFEPKSNLHTYRCFSFTSVNLTLPVCQIIATDRDLDDACSLRYELVEGGEMKHFRLDTINGIFYPTSTFIPKGSYDFVVQMSDCGQPALSSTVHVIIRVVPILTKPEEMPNSKPLIEPTDPVVSVSRDDPVGTEIAFIKTIDDDFDKLVTYIISGNSDNCFAFLDTGAFVLAKSLKNRYVPQYNLTLMVTDGLENSTLTLLVNVHSDLGHVVPFSQQNYTVNVLENITIGSDILQLNFAENELTSLDSVFSIYSTLASETLTKFEMESWSGKLKVKSALDYESGKQHVLIIEARSSRKASSSFHQRSFTKVIINLLDCNDHVPQFILPYFEATVLESSAVGTSVLQVQAFDGDFGHNAAINYSIATGNFDGAFDMEPSLGYIYLKKQLSFKEQPEYYLLVRATDSGVPPLSSTANVHILVSIPDNSPPKFEQDNYFVDIREDEKIGTVILSLRMASKQTIFFEITAGNEDSSFAINVNNGEIYLRKSLDFERHHNYTLTVSAVSLFGMKDTANIFISVIDVNDNVPFWRDTVFEGQVYETMLVNSIVQTEEGSPLVISAFDNDSLHNAILQYSIVEEHAREYFKIEPRTGAVSLIKRLDYEKFQEFTFSVSVSDYGLPSLKAISNALVRIKCLPVNDCAPVFSLNNYYANLLLPTYNNVIITSVGASDCDLRPESNPEPHLHYNLTYSESARLFAVNSTTGQITTATDQFESGLYEFEVTAFDGKHTSKAKVIINGKPLPHSSLRFRHERYYGTILENSSLVKTVVMPNIEGNKLHEHLIFRIMNPTEHFRIARTSGAILFRGPAVDREVVNKFELKIEVQSISLKNRAAHALIEVKVEDINDNHPIFVGLPYHFVFNSDSEAGTAISKVQAVDMDTGRNGQVTYSVVSGDTRGLFALNAKTGQLSLAREFDVAQDSLDYTLRVMAKDLGEPPLESFSNVTLRMVSGGLPIFSQATYNVSVSESHPPLVPFLTIKAESPNGRQIFYNIEQGNENEEFALDFSTDSMMLTNTLCMVSIAEKLDRETTSHYNLVVSATDTITGASATANLYIEVLDTNDNYPMFSRFSYNVSVPENLPVGSQILRVGATDADVGLNGKLQYTIVGNSSQTFYMSPDDGIISLKTSLDYEADDSHHFTIMVTDYGSPQLTSTAQVFVEVQDCNDNPPTLPATFSTTIDEDIGKGDFVTKITAMDADWSDRDNLRYRILSGSEMAFTMNETSGALYVRNLKNSRNLPYRSFRSLLHIEHARSRATKRHYSLNVSVSDGVYSTTQLYIVNVKPSNHYSPKFSRLMHNIAVSEGTSLGEQIFTINATDRDNSEQFGVVEYTILNEYARKFFVIDGPTGKVVVRSNLDYEKGDKFYWLVLGAQDKGKRLGVSALRVAITDLNDNIPRFIVKEYKSTVCSNVPTGSTILPVLAVDDDEFVENQIKYSIYEKRRPDQEVTESEPLNETVALINDYFEISSDTGYIFTRANLSALEGKMVQFFVRVSNLNYNLGQSMKNSIENVVPVSIQVTGQCQTAKKEAFLYEVFVKESVERGSVVVTTNLEGYKEVDLSIVGFDDRNDAGRFRIDKFGRISVNEPLDRETKSKHVLAIQLKDKTTFAVEYFYVIIQVMDENDCVPFFDSAAFYLSVAENQEVGSEIFKFTAFDNDLSSALKYSQCSPQNSFDENQDSPFSLDENSGWLTLKKELDRETTARYSLKICVTDGVHQNSTTFNLEVVDFNDQPPVLEKSNYIAAIFENSLLGTVVVTIEATDPDLNSDLHYYITDGDYLNQFSVSSNGDVYVNKPLDREFISKYALKILVTDGKFQTETELSIDILDINDHGPVCVKSKYKEMVREDVLPGTYILTVEATDDDDTENSKRYYTLEGDHRGHFSIDAASGQLKTNGKLDRETQATYVFKAVVYDDQNRQWSCTSFIEILLSDCNDEPPKFLSQLNTVNIPEDSPVGVILGKVTAIDLDQGMNRRVRYDLLSPSGEFAIHEQTGILRLTKSLDRETQSSYNISIMAYDSGFTILNSTTFFIVNVLDINDNPPDFEMQSYSASIDENAPIGSELIKIFATSKDTGINAEIKYMIVAGNENDTFSMHSKTGLVTLSKGLDYETTKEYFLTIKAQDEGIPPLSSEVNLRVAVNDINDVRPQFVQRSYDIVIREDAQVGDRIIQLVALDQDSPPNANLTYSFTGESLSYKEFSIDPILGLLSVGRPLDREMMSAYILEVFCTDNGHPRALFSSVLINVEISDYNDNAPKFDKWNQTVHVQEGRPVGYTLLNFVLTDADSSQNSGPFKLAIVEGNEEAFFAIVDSDASLRTNIIFNSSIVNEYRLAIQATDSGSPPLSSTNWVTVVVIQEPQMPPQLHALSISVNTLDHFPGGVIGQLNASDEDQFDKLTYSLTHENDKHIFSINANDGTLLALPGLDPGKYNVNVTVTDDKFTTTGLVQVEVTLLTEAMVENAIVIEVRSISVKNFVAHHLKNFVRILKNLLNVRSTDIVILSVQPAERKSLRRLRSDETTFGDVSVMFAVANTMHSNYYTRNWLKGKLAEGKFTIESQMGLSFDEVMLKSKCEHIRCSHGECREDLVLSEKEITSVSSSLVSFVSPFHEYRSGCSCHAGYGGKLCNLTVNECARNPCPPHKECLPVTSSLGYVCQCPFGKSGPSCNQNAETCHSNDRDVSFCYQEFNPISFSGNSYVRYGAVRKIDKVALRFRSQQLRAKIFVQQGERAFNLLEIAGGYVQYRFDCGQGEGLVRIHNQIVNDGKWHEIIVERKGTSVSVVLDRKFRGGGFAPGSASSCARLKDDIYFGGEVKSFSKTAGDEDILSGFIGCLDNILFNGQQVPFHTTSSSSVVTLKTLAGVEFGCNFKADIGACRLQPCLNGGTCENLSDGSYSCSCVGPRYTGKHCAIDSKPCDSSPCLNGGVCVADEAACAAGLANCFKCECGGGFTGTNCQLSRYCSATLCHNGGVCEETSLGPKCHCHTGWHGLYCQLDIDECTLSTPTCTHPATCINLPGTYRCLCPINSTLPCKGEGLLPSNIVSSRFSITYEEGIAFIVILFVIILLGLLCACRWSCKNRKPKNRTPKNKLHVNDPLLKNQANTIYENFNGFSHTRASKNSNMEMSTMTNNAIILGQSQRPISYNEFFNPDRGLPSTFFNDEFDPSNPTSAASLATDPSANYNKKSAPIASVSPQLIETKRSPKNNLKGAGATKCKSSQNDLIKQSPQRVSLNDSSDSTVFNDEQPPSLTNSNPAEGYHWDNLDLYLQDGHDPNGLSNLVEFPSANGDGRLLPSRRQPLKEPDTETISEHSQTEVLLTESQKMNFEKNKTRRLSKGSSKNPNESLNGDESSPLLSACSCAHKIDGTNTGQNSPALETKVNLTSNLFEYYLPKHDDEWTSGLNQGFKRKNILQYPNPEEETAAKEMNGNGRGEGAMLTFHRSSLDASADNFSLLTPSSSISTTPINALVKSNSIGDTTADQCSSSMSSGSSNPPSDSKVSPVNLYASQHLYANTGPASCLSSFGYGTVGAHNGTSHFNGKDTIVVSKKNRTTSYSKPTETVINGDQQQQQAKPKPALPSSTQTTYV